MCGIAGIIGRISEDNRRSLRRMAAAMAHRGPDDERFFESTADASGIGVMLAHRRLSILDLSDAGAQPMTDAATGRHTIVTNGEIYNYVDLRDRMRAQGQVFRSSGDTEVMLRLLAMRGLSSVGDLRGMFAFALWNGETGQLALGRDPLGIKPLYVCFNRAPEDAREWSVVFASEVRAILASGLIRNPALNPEAVANFIWNGFVVGPDTIVEGIELLPPGAVMTLDRTGNVVGMDRVASVPPAAVPKDATIAEVRDALHESVRVHLASDVPLGVFLSGGIDSSAVANIAARESSSPVVTFTLSFEEQDYDEGPIARQIAKAIGTQHEEVRFTERDALDSLEQALDSIDQPTFDGLNSYYISKAVRETGIKVALAGSGGDELFGGYQTFRHLPRFKALSGVAAWLPKSFGQAAAEFAASLLERRYDEVGAQAKWAKLPGMMEDPGNILWLYQMAYALFVPQFQSRLLRGASSRDGLPVRMREELQKDIAGRSALAALGVLEQRLFLGERLLRDTDVASMAVSLETRLPLVDRNVTAVVSRLPDKLRFEPLGRKQLLRDVGLEGLDPALFERPKRGFQMPFDRWIRRRLGKEMHGVMCDADLAASVGLNGAAVSALWRSYQSGGSVFWTRIWAIYVLLRWCERHGLGIRTSTDQAPNVAALAY